jgi:hypothetical protein
MECADDAVVQQRSDVPVLPRTYQRRGIEQPPLLIAGDASIAFGFSLPGDGKSPRYSFNTPIRLSMLAMLRSPEGFTCCVT